ncbi:hypothetical protein ACOSP7_031267 [Xanthoceras sorbifolium]
MDLLLLATILIVGSEYHATEAESNTMADNVVDISTDDEEDEDYNLVSGGWISEESDDSETYVNLNEVQFNEEEDEDLNAAENAFEDEVPEDTKSDEDILLDSVSFN